MPHCSWSRNSTPTRPVLTGWMSLNSFRCNCTVSVLISRKRAPTISMVGYGITTKTSQQRMDINKLSSVSSIQMILSGLNWASRLHRAIAQVCHTLLNKNIGKIHRTNKQQYNRTWTRLNKCEKDARTVARIVHKTLISVVFSVPFFLPICLSLFIYKRFAFMCVCVCVFFDVLFALLAAFVRLCDCCFIVWRIASKAAVGNATLRRISLITSECWGCPSHMPW